VSQIGRPKRKPARAVVAAAPTPAGATAPRLIGYARVSTADQTTRPQLDALRAAGCAEVFEDVLSGSVDERDGLQTCLDALRAGDTLIVPRLDRLGRSMPHLVSTVHALAARGVGFRSLAESIDTTSATGRLVLHLFAALADFERGLIVERTKASLTAKKRRGEPLGRPRALTPAQVREARGMIERGKTIAYAARALRCGRATLYCGFAAESVAAEQTLTASSSPAQTAAVLVVDTKTVALLPRVEVNDAGKFTRGKLPCTRCATFFTRQSGHLAALA
jgi:DNA invertase Pin-like site-specific DNA recombinase